MDMFSLEQVRAILLAAQGLTAPPAHKATKDDVLAAIHQMGLLQIDTISVVARSQYLVLWSRLGAYAMRWLDDLHREGALFEYWAHAACLLPIEDYAIYRQHMLDYAENDANVDKLGPEIRQAISKTHEYILEHGAARSVDFKDSTKKAGTWWNRSPEKRALEYQFNAGVLMISQRTGFQRVYDLRERVHPYWDDRDTCSHEEGMRMLIEKAAKALGAASTRWLCEYFPNYLRSREAKGKIPRILDELARTGVLIKAAVEGFEEPAYIHRENIDLAKLAINGALQSSVTTFLSPFDPVISDRKRTEKLFDFSYRLEAYMPADQRRYGYFSLPILHQGSLVGRMDAKAHRKAGMFEVKALYLEPGVPASEDLTRAVADALQAFADWHAAPEITLGHCDLPDLAEALMVS